MAKVQSHSHTSLKDVIDEHFANIQHQRSLPIKQRVHLKNPLIQKAARVYLAMAIVVYREQQK